VFAWLGCRPRSRPTACPAARFADVLDEQEPRLDHRRDGRLAGPTGWLQAVGGFVQEAIERRLASTRREARTAKAAGERVRRETVRWIAVEGQRRAFRIVAEPLDGGGAAGWAMDVTRTEDSRDALKRHVDAHDETLNHLADAVAIFDSSKRLSFHNTAFAELWGLEPAWLEESPSHAEVLDRLRQRRRLPETADYGVWKGASWLLRDAGRPARRAVEPARRAHPARGAPAPPAGRAAAAVRRHHRRAAAEGAVQRPDQGAAGHARQAERRRGGVRLRRPAAPAQRGVRALLGHPDRALPDTADFDAVVELCTPKLHNRQFWSDLKAVSPTRTRRRAPPSRARSG
jgi:PAS domain-containing protein